MAFTFERETGGQIPARFIVGDRVDVLRACRLPNEEVIESGVIERVTGEFPNQLYWISGFPCARTANVLRLIVRG